mmetsp:Transcript_1637/g.1449  ORF Transcript_1637/g.1449 Transcript_1637/m.1449 type:complete len:148 (+) Transcript_1637:3-446(+)
MIGLTISSLDDKKVTDHERQYLLTLEMRKKGIKVPTKEKTFEIAGQRAGYGGRGWQGGKPPPRKTAPKLPKGIKMTNLGDRPPIKKGLSIVGNEMDIIHPLDDHDRSGSAKENYDMYQPQDQYPSYEELMKQAALPSNIQINKKNSQ